MVISSINLTTRDLIRMEKSGDQTSWRKICSFYRGGLLIWLSQYFLHTNAPSYFMAFHGQHNLQIEFIALHKMPKCLKVIFIHPPILFKYLLGYL